MNAEHRFPNQLISFLPTQAEISSLMAHSAFADIEDKKKIEIEGTIHNLTAKIVASPSNHDLWCELAMAFGLLPMLKWKFISAAYTLRHDSSEVLSDLAWATYLLGDREHAISLMAQAVSLSCCDTQRATGIQYMHDMRVSEYSSDELLTRH